MSQENYTNEEIAICLEDGKAKYPEGSEHLRFRERIKQIEREYPVGRPLDEEDLVVVPSLVGTGAFAGCDDDPPYTYGYYVKRSSIKR